MIHIAILRKPYLNLILAGDKTVECRLTQQARAPFESIETGDRIYFKLSAGPYAATAVADYVLFEDELTPKRVQQIKRDYNDLICGDSYFWRAKHNSNYCTLIWLREVEAVNTGPLIAPLQGLAWKVLDEEPAWRRRDLGDHCFAVTITDANLRNNTLYLTHVFDRFPRRHVGGRTKAEAGRPITLMLHDGPTVESDIVGPRKMFRTRVWGKWLARHGARPGDHVIFTPVNRSKYLVGLARGNHQDGRQTKQNMGAQSL